MLRTITRARRGRRSGCAHALPAVLLGVAAFAAHAVDAEDPARERARALRLAQEGRCEAALPLLDGARIAAPRDAELALRAGQCRLRLHRYPEAARDLAVAVDLAPDRGAAWLALAKARYHARDLAGAATALDAAAPGLGDDAEVAFYRGMLHIEAGEDALAIPWLERARSLEPDRVEPVASLQLALARARTRDREGARADLERVVDVWQGTDWETRAGRELSRLRAGERRQAWLSLGAAVEHDSNVVLRGRGVPRPAEVGDEHDVRGVWSGNGGLELWKGEQVTLGAMASYRGTTHADLSSFDAHFPSATTWLDWTPAEDWLANARYDFGYAWLDGDPFLATHSWQLSLQRATSRWGRSLVRGRMHTDEYFFDGEDVPDAAGAICPVGVLLCSPPGVDERSARRRSGWGAGAGIGHRLPLAAGPLPLRDPSLRAGYDFAYFDARGSEYSHRAHTLHLGLATGLPFAFAFDVLGAYTWRPFRNPSTFPDPPVSPGVPYVLSDLRRRERVLEIETVLSRPIGEALSVEAWWRLVDNHSNRDVFDYEHQVFGLGFNLAFGREL